MAILTFTLSTASCPQFSQRKVICCSPFQCFQSPKKAINIEEISKPTFSEKGLHMQHYRRHAIILPPRPRRIILVRHGQSERNVDESAYTRVADPKIALTEKGKAEAQECERSIRQMIEKDGADDWKVHFYVLPYRRTLETLQNLVRAFEREWIAGMREEPRICEQDFRFRETLRIDIDIRRFQLSDQKSLNMNLVIVCHGLALRVFLMRWYKWRMDQFEVLNNMSNGHMFVMEKSYGGRYNLLMHHSEEELKEFGLTKDMLIDQEW